MTCLLLPVCESNGSSQSLQNSQSCHPTSLTVSSDHSVTQLAGILRKILLPVSHCYRLVTVAVKLPKAQPPPLLAANSSCSQGLSWPLVPRKLATHCFGDIRESCLVLCSKIRKTAELKVCSHLQQVHEKGRLFLVHSWGCHGCAMEACGEGG